MTDFYVPVIKAGKPYLYKIEVARQTGGLGCLSVCGRAKGQGNEGIDNLIGKITACIASPLKASVDLINVDSGDYLSAREISSSTQSITLGLMTAIEFVHESRILSSPWDAIVITGDYDAAHSLLLEVGDIAEKVEAMRKLSAKNPAGKILFVYVAEEALADIPNTLFFPKSTKIADFWAELFKPEFDGTQQRFLNRAFMFDKSAAFICNEQFKLARKEARSENWKGYFIYGDGESGKTTFAYRLCSYLMSVREYYAPVWISMNYMDGMDGLTRQKGEKYNGLTKSICGQLIPFWKEADGVSQVYQMLLNRKYVLVIDNLELQACELLEGILRETFSALQYRLPVIITSRYDDSKFSLEKSLSIKKMEVGAVSREQCAEIVRNNNPDFALLDRDKQDELMDLLATNYSDSPGIIAFAAKGATEDSIGKIIGSLQTQTGDLQGYMANLVRESFMQLPEQTKHFLYCFVRKHYEKQFDFLKANDFAGDFDRGDVRKCLQSLSSLKFIYTDDGESFDMKSVFFRILTLSDFGFAGKDTYIDVKMRLETAVASHLDTAAIEDLLSELRESRLGNLGYMTMRIRRAIHMNAGMDVIKLLLEEVGQYGGTKDGVINETAGEYENLLHAALDWSENAEVLKMLLQNGGKVDIIDEMGGTLLHSIYGPIPEYGAKCDLLLKQGLDVNRRDYMKCTPLSHAVEYGTKEQVRHLIMRGADVHASDYGGATPLHIAVKEEDKEKIQVLLDNGAAIEARDLYGYAPVHLAIHNYEIFTYLLEHGADITAKTGDGESLLDLMEMGPYIEWNPEACGTENLVCFGSVFLEKLKNECSVHEVLIDRGVKRYFHPKGFKKNWFDERLEMAERIFNQDELFLDAMTKPLDLLKNAFDAEENLLKRDDSNKSLLHYSVLNKDINVTAYLLEKGMGVNRRDDYGQTPLLYAARHGVNTNILKLLLEYGADIHAVDKDDNSVLHLSAINPAAKIAEFFLNSDCNTDLRDNKGFLPVGMAAFNPNHLVHLLFTQKASMTDLEKSYLSGETCLPDSVLLFEDNSYCSIVSHYYDMANKDDDYKKTQEFLKREITREVEDTELKDFLMGSYGDEQQKNLLDMRLAFSTSNPNPKLPVLWARQGGDLSLQNNDGETVLEYLKKHPDWKYIQKQLQKHKLIDKDDRIIG